jgi:hypothetical protein
MLAIASSFLWTTYVTRHEEGMKDVLFLRAITRGNLTIKRQSQRTKENWFCEEGYPCALDTVLSRSCLSVCRRMLVEIKIQFQNVNSWLSQETKLPALSMLRNERSHFVNTYSTRLGNAS